jgi:hypothetical protein
MTLKTLQLTIVLMTFAAISLAQTKQSSTRFTSVYTDLGRGCRVIRGQGGTDDASVCRGVGGYQVRVFGAAAAMYISAELKGSDERFTLATLDTSFNETKTRLEWRLANGKPFAVILRVPKYGDSTPENPYFGKVIGQHLVIAGLKGFDIDLSIDANEANANAKARELADKAYLDSLKK